MRLDYPATSRNREAILAVLQEELPSEGLVLEIASGSGQHVAYFAQAMPALTWQPSDVEAPALASIAAWCDGMANVRSPVALDVLDTWPVSRVDAIVATNLVHISPWEATEALVAGAARLLPPGGLLFLYGPYRVTGVPMAPSNEAFDASLRARNPEWGVRDLDAVVALARAAGMGLQRTVGMPANNLSVVLRAG